MTKIILATYLAFSMPLSIASEPVENCVFNNELVPAYESIWLEDAILIADATRYYREDGYTQSQIERALKNHDWTGFRLVCLPIVSYMPDNQPSTIGQNLLITSYQMTFTDVSLDYFQYLMKRKAEKISQ